MNTLQQKYKELIELLPIAWRLSTRNRVVLESLRSQIAELEAKEEDVGVSYKIINRYPNMQKENRYVGDIINLPCYEKSTGQWFIQEGEDKTYDAFFEGFPHLFTEVESTKNEELVDISNKKEPIESAREVFTFLDYTDGEFNYEDIIERMEIYKNQRKEEPIQSADDKLNNLSNRIAMQIRFHTISGKSFPDTVDDITSIVEDYINKQITQ